MLERRTCLSKIFSEFVCARDWASRGGFAPLRIEDPAVRGFDVEMSVIYHISRSSKRRVV